MKILRLGLLLLGLGLGAVLLAVAGLWWWLGSDGSLATLLAQVQRVLPAGQTLQAKDVRGTLRFGGHIGWLRWSQPGFSLEARAVDLAWTLPALLQRQLQFTQFDVAEITVVDEPSVAATARAVAPAQLRWPVTVEVPFSVASLRYAGTTQLLLTELAGNYVFDSYKHRLYKGKGHISSGKYEFSAELEAQGALALMLQVQGLVDATLPASRQRLMVAAQAQLAGTLAGPEAALTLQATLQPELSAARTDRAPAMQATLTAHIKPWQAQPLTQLNAQWQALNLAPLWPQAPQTQLSGSLSVQPLKAAWQGQIILSNALAGPLNQQRLPVQSLQATLGYVQGQWGLTALRASVGAGSVTGSGQFKDGQWQGSFDLAGLDPAALDSRLLSLPLSGRWQAQQASGGINFSAQLQAAASRTAVRLQSLKLQGAWAAPLLKLDVMQLDAEEGRLQGQLSYHSVTQALQGQLTLTLPGLNGVLGGHLAAEDGKGELRLRVTDAALAVPWLRQWPQLAQALAQVSVQGAAELKLAWQGGWQQQGRSLALDASLRAARLALRTGSLQRSPEAEPWQFDDLQAYLSGTLTQLALRSQGRWRSAGRWIDWQARASAAQVATDHWQASLSQLIVDLRTASSAQPWSLQLAASGTEPVTLDWRPTGLGQQLSIGAGSARITGGDAADLARLSWLASSWSPAPAALALPSQWHSQGQLSGLPLSWLEAWGVIPLAELGLGSSMTLDGSWQATQAERLQLHARLSRGSGDLSLHAGPNGPLLAHAGVSEASAQLQLVDGQLDAELRWSSERAGAARLVLHSLLQAQNGGWDWPPEAPVAGTVTLHGPPIALWSTLLAPPGWRLNGTLDASATLSGTRGQPQWHGSLQGKDLGVSSVLDGIDFRQGSLSAKLDGQHIRIEEFTLVGAKGEGAAQGGTLNITGSAQWADADAPGVMPLAGLRLALRAQARALRLSTRSDRRLVVSGDLVAEFKAAQLSVRGALSADQALITLPSESAPALGDDVVLRSARAPAAAAAGPASPGPPSRWANATAQLTLDLGPNFLLRGRGLDTRLAGQLELRASGRAAPTLHGTLRAVRGTYQAYGQRLDIEQGVLHFAGPVDNPALDILALRSNLPQRVGVQVNGSVLSPIMRLYADPELPEPEKLAWLVMGRSSSGAGGEAALLQQAALALLSGQRPGPSASLTQALGLDELSFRGNPGDSASAATIKLGKRFANDFYLAYESGLAASMGVLSIFYDLSQSLTLRARTGEQSALDLIWTRRFD